MLMNVDNFWDRKFLVKWIWKKVNMRFSWVSANLQLERACLKKKNYPKKDIRSIYIK